MSKIFNPQEKILSHFSKVKEYLNNKNPDPITIEIDPSNACNHSCPFCISGHLHLSKYKDSEFFNRTMLKEAVFKSMVKNLVKTKIKAINWTGGGEPTLNPYLGKAIQYIKNNSQIQMGMFTNGSLLEKFNLFDTVVDSLEWIRISIDAGNEDSYNNLRITNSNNNFKVVLENIKKLIEVKKKKNSKIVIGIGFVVTKDNYEEILDFSKIFKDINVDYCQFKPEIIQIEREKISNDLGRVQIESDFWINKVIVSLDAAKKILGKKFECNSYKLEDLIVDGKKYGRNYKQCIGSQFQPCIGADGNVYVCTNHRGHKRYSYGNINEKNFSEIWGNVEKKKEVMDIINNKEKFSKCTHLCKPHESNKILWKIKENFENADYVKKIENTVESLKKNLKHINFI